MSEDSYIYWDDDDIPDAERRVYIQCQECYDKNKRGIKWVGELGYGGRVICQCGHVINSGDDDEKDTTSV